MLINRQISLAAGLAAAIGFGLTGGALAADLSDNSYGMQVPYVQSDMGDTGYQPAAHRRRYLAPPPVYLDNGDGQPQDFTQGYAQPLYPDQQQQDVYIQEPLPPQPNGRCLQGRQIENLLGRQGWREFSNPQRGVDVVGLTARRPNGLTYRLKLDRCTGVIIQTYLLDQPQRQQAYAPDGQTPGY